MNYPDLIDDFKQKKRGALARVITLVDNEEDEGIEFLKENYEKRKDSFRIGITGPPGVGKSSLVNHLLERFAKKYENFGVIAIDPSSPFTGGALLGDRLRMQKSYEFENVFIRSIASRGSLGGLSTSTENISQVMESFGMDVILIETVGVGQSELDIMEITDIVIVVLVPESGDSIQAMKAGLMEIGDIFVVNKSDRDGADRAVEFIKSSLSFKKNIKNNETPVIKTSASNEDNIDSLFLAIEDRMKFLNDSDELKMKREQRREREVKDILRDLFIKSIDKLIKNMENVNASPYEKAKKILEKTGFNFTEDLWKKR
ncbi:TPA: methylmalonyl Co-A mutase-associated GTPase MeaB [candidate division WOR-3 bacterium]|uniref:Methylmalonyl Co-A mutase-associated GTPase MeaB n=1 Tax=candidate division WOR-3 bacterium TaxID=2052148 RepID=A0A350HC86_UNCW3|nr:methylmalonyl Co-A mutase-associated GTPase MeaB [candidate division WOR-3 bacterium]